MICDLLKCTRFLRVIIKYKEKSVPIKTQSKFAIFSHHWFFMNRCTSWTCRQWFPAAQDPRDHMTVSLCRRWNKTSSLVSATKSDSRWDPRCWAHGNFWKRQGYSNLNGGWWLESMTIWKCCIWYLVSRVQAEIQRGGHIVFGIANKF